MNSDLHLFLAHARAAELRAAGDGIASPAHDEDESIPATTPVTLRFAFPDDADALARLAALDSSVPPAMPVLLGEVGGQIVAALSLADGAVVADPFRPTLGLVELLRARAAQLRGETTSRVGRALRLRRLAWR